MRPPFPPPDRPPDQFIEIRRGRWTPLRKNFRMRDTWHVPSSDSATLLNPFGVGRLVRPNRVRRAPGRARAGGGEARGDGRRTSAPPAPGTDTQEAPAGVDGRDAATDPAGRLRRRQRPHPRVLLGGPGPCPPALPGRTSAAKEGQQPGQG